MVLRWLMLLLVAFDLAGSPFHLHKHDVGAYGAGAWAALGEHSHARPSDDRGESDLAHSSAALRSAGLAPAAVKARAGHDTVTAPTPVRACAGAQPRLELVRARASVARGGKPPRLRPDGRAPPVHVG